MKKYLAALLGAAFVAAASVQPVRADVPFGFSTIIGAPVGVIWHSRVVYRCQKRDLTRSEFERTLVFPISSVLRAYRDCKK